MLRKRKGLPATFQGATWATIVSGAPELQHEVRLRELSGQGRDLGSSSQQTFPHCFSGYRNN